MNKDNFSKNTAILVILGSIILVIISSYLAIGEITKFKNVKEILQIIISIVGLFATFGGAYLGAKVSGENASQIAKKERIISSVMNNLEFNKDILNDFNLNITKDLKEIIEMNNLKDIDSLIVFYVKLTRLKGNLESIIKSGTQKGVFSLILFDYENLKEYIDSLFKIVQYEYTKTFGLVGKSIGLKEGGTLAEFSDQNYIRFEEQDNRRFVVAIISGIEKNKSVDMEKLNSMYKKSDINTEIIFENVHKVRNTWGGFTFKDVQDINSFINNYYKI
ncbi:hypothetical protein QI089_09435 [Staphylococcus saprophyticus]|uniref:hypothetical protein n=1 Tax=Staphylococcus saprophyticus TaxID=29385 RepID=UPI001886BE36|nr:hypothetical protein [Staphylococcus saprophyticus]MBF2777849.1 hypothetical protein [Staphylococcus saprophyticus]MDW4357176.1 hypothetical protein [Staphylococcus saprophyticus]MEB7677495.1 hypothetical protein [Staphylococcus saprophyticus]